MVLAARSLLFVVLLAACALNYLAVSDPQVLRLVAAGIFNAMVLGPMTWLSYYKG